MALNAVILTDAEADVLVVEMNILLRSMNMSLEHAEAYNSLFKQLTGEDHESMIKRRD